MEWYVILILVLAAPIMLLPVAFIWYLNIGGIVAALRHARQARRVACEEARLAEK